MDQEVALRVLDDCGFDPGLAAGLCNFLLTITTEEGGVPFVLPSVANAPRAPWWNSPPNPPASLNPTAAIAGLLHKHGVDHPWLGPATAYCWAGIEAMPVPEAHLLRCIFTFLEHVPDRTRAEPLFDRVAAAMLASDVISLDPEAEGYVHGPLDFAPTPESLCRPLFESRDIEAHLDALAAKQQEDGGWPIAWPPASEMGGLEYRGMRSLDALDTLRSYGRLQP